jgi:hypothetical protein
LVFILRITQKNDKIDKDKFITPVYTLIGMAGFTLNMLQFWPNFAIWCKLPQCGLELAVTPLTQNLWQASTHEIAFFAHQPLRTQSAYRHD